jgi:K(+)-stimulated pyrophosphate-energized sodium pump
MNILIKLMSIVSLVIAPTLAQIHGHEGHGVKKATKEMNVTVINTGDASQSVTITDDDALISALKKDGLITSETFSIDVDHGVLKVNGKEVDIAKYKDLIKGEKLKIEMK